MKQKPKPPEGRKECGTCGYSAPESEYHHPICWVGLLYTIVLAFAAGLAGATIIGLVIKYLTFIHS